MATRTATTLICDECGKEVANPGPTTAGGWYFLLRKPSAPGGERPGRYHVCGIVCLMEWGLHERKRLSGGGQAVREVHRLVGRGEEGT